MRGSICAVARTVVALAPIIQRRSYGVSCTMPASVAAVTERSIARNGASRGPVLQRGTTLARAPSKELTRAGLPVPVLRYTVLRCTVLRSLYKVLRSLLLRSPVLTVLRSLVPSAPVISVYRYSHTERSGANRSGAERSGCERCRVVVPSGSAGMSQFYTQPANAPETIRIRKLLARRTRLTRVVHIERTGSCKLH